MIRRIALLVLAAFLTTALLANAQTPSPRARGKEIEHPREQTRPARPLAARPVPMVLDQQSDYASETVRLLNAERARAGLWPMRAEAHLAQTSADHNAWMDSHQVFCHDCPGELTLGERIDASGYPSWWRAGEIMTLNIFTPDAAVAAWMGSPEHKALVLSRNYGDVGCGYLNGVWGVLFTCDLAYNGDYDGPLPPPGFVPPTATPSATATATPTSTPLATATPTLRPSVTPTSGPACQETSGVFPDGATYTLRVCRP